MNWLKSKLQDWLEIRVQHECNHKWEVLETKKIEELFQLPPQEFGHFVLPNPDRKTYITIKTKYIMKCSKCGDLKAEIL